jgi:2-methylisocitrate lyase-like PEP mutase family enzyme
MVDNAGRIAEASGLPLIADADTGYGGPINVRRTIQAYERAGVAGVHIEDQQWPKRCGHLAGKTLIPTEEMSAKIKAAVDARMDDDFVVIARSDALAVEGFDAVMARGKAYEEAGADIIFIEAPLDMDQLRQIPEAFDVPTLYNLASSGKTPLLPANEIQDLGFKIVIYPNLAILAAIPAITDMLAELKETGEVTGILDRVATFRQFFDLLGMEEIQELEERYAVSDDAKVGY